MIKSFHIPGLEIVNRNTEQDNRNYYVDYKKVLEKFNLENGGKWRYPSIKELNFSDGMEYVEERDLWKIPSGDNRIRMVKDIG